MNGKKIEKCIRTESPKRNNRQTRMNTQKQKQKQKQNRACSKSVLFVKRKK